MCGLADSSWIFCAGGGMHALSNNHHNKLHILCVHRLQRFKPDTGRDGRIRDDQLVHNYKHCTDGWSARHLSEHSLQHGANFIVRLLLELHDGLVVVDVSHPYSEHSGNS